MSHESKNLFFLTMLNFGKKKLRPRGNLDHRQPRNAVFVFLSVCHRVPGLPMPRPGGFTQQLNERTSQNRHFEKA